MAESIQGATVDLHFLATMLNALNVVTGAAPLDLRKTYNFTSGTGANKANAFWTDKRTLAASANESLDLSGVLTDAFGATVTFTKLKALMVIADPGNVNDVVLGAGSNPWIGALGATSVLNVKPGGCCILVAPDAVGMPITASTGDILKVANSSSGTGVTYTIVALGEE